MGDVTETLTEQECYLAAILLDRSGVDLAEFAFVDENRDDKCYRLYPYQYSWFRDPSPKSVAACSRSVGKCLAGDTKVLLANGTERPIREMVASEYDIHWGIQSYDLETHELVASTAVAYSSGAKPLREITLGSGHEIVCTKEHRIYAMIDSGDPINNKKAQWGWVEAGDLQLGQLVSHATSDCSHITSSIVSGIKFAGFEETFDITVLDDSPPNFIANGILVHNSESIMLETAAFPFSYPDQDHVLGVPQGTQADNLTLRMETKFKACKLMSEMIPNIGSSGITHRPFTINWANGAHFYVRLPQLTGQGWRGVHPAKMSIDEGQDIPEVAYNEALEVVRWDIPGASMKIYGVSKGIRGDFFWRASETKEMDYKRHHFTAMHRPDWSDEQRASKEKEYGGSEAPAYLRNVKGLPGNEENRIFVLDNFMRCVDTREGSDYNLQEYFHAVLDRSELESQMGSGANMDTSSDAFREAIESILQFPSSHKAKYGAFWMGMDVGLVADPSELFVMAEYEPDADERRADKRLELAVPEKGDTRFKVLTRVSMKQITAPLQAGVIMFMINHYGPKAFAMDGTGIGLPTFQMLQQLAGASRLVEVHADPNEAIFQSAKKALTVIKNYNFSGKIPVEIDETVAERLGDVPPSQLLKEAGIYWNVRDRATEVLRQWVDTKRFRFPYDLEFIQDMNAQTFTLKKAQMDPWGRSSRSFSKGEFHILDGMRMAALGASQQPMENLIASEKPKEWVPVPPLFGF